MWPLSVQRWNANPNPNPDPNPNLTFTPFLQIRAIFTHKGRHDMLFELRIAVMGQQSSSEKNTNSTIEMHN